MIEISPSGRAACRSCLASIAGGSVRVFKMVPGPYGHESKHCYHLTCYAPTNLYHKDPPEIWKNDLSRFTDEQKNEVEAWKQNWRKLVLERIAEDKRKFLKRKCPKEEDRKHKKRMVSSKTNATHYAIPKDIVGIIANYLDGADIFRFLMTTRQWFIWFDAEDDFWKHKSKKILKIEENTDPSKEINITWRLFYAKVIQDGCIDCGSFSDYFPFIGNNLCNICRGKQEYRLVTKTDAKRFLKATDEDLNTLFCQVRGVGTYYLAVDVEEVVNKKKGIPFFHQPTAEKTKQHRKKRKKDK